MDCNKAQRLLHEQPTGQLDESVARHLSECSDCRVAQQRAVRLQQLLTVKRHETPGAHYLDGFLHSFHRRLDAETAPQPAWWARWLAPLRLPNVPVFRYGFAQACGILIALGLVTRAFIGTDVPEKNAAPAVASAGASQFQTANALPAPQSTPQKIAVALPRASEPIALATGDLVLPVAARTEPQTSRYVLDRISLTPASYEVASIHF